MKIKQLTKLDQGRLDIWYDLALNNPRVRPYMQHTTFNVPFTVEDGDWQTAHFMDDGDNCYMRLSFDREKKEMRMSLWSLEESQATVAAMMRVAILVAPKHYNMEYITFSIHDANKAWLKSWMRRFHQHRWGVEPNAAWDIEAQAWCPSHHFKIPIAAIQQYLKKGIPS